MAILGYSFRDPAFVLGYRRHQAGDGRGPTRLCRHTGGENAEQEENHDNRLDLLQKSVGLDPGQGNCDHNCEGRLDAGPQEKGRIVWRRYIEDPIDHPRWTLICCYNAARNDPYQDSHHPRYRRLAKLHDHLLKQIAREQLAASKAKS